MSIDEGKDRAQHPVLTRPHPFFSSFALKDAPQAQLKLLNPTLQNTLPALIPPCCSPGWIHPAFHKAERKDVGHFSKSSLEGTFFSQNPILPLP